MGGDSLCTNWLAVRYADVDEPGEIAEWLISACAFSYEWQTIIAALVALAAARWTVVLIRRQIKLQEDQHQREDERYEDRQKSISLASRAELPDALSHLTEYVGRCADFVLGDDGEQDLPSPPVDSIGSMQRAIGNVDPESAKMLYDLVVFYQIYNSRLASFASNRRQTRQKGILYDTGYLQFLIDRLYEYARNEVEEISDREATADLVRSGLRIAVGLKRFAREQDRLSEAFEEIKRRHP